MDMDMDMDVDMDMDMACMRWSWLLAHADALSESGHRRQSMTDACSMDME